MRIALRLLYGNNKYVCQECGHEWNPNEKPQKTSLLLKTPMNILENGDSVIVIKDLPVKEHQTLLKQALKLKT